MLIPKLLNWAKLIDFIHQGTNRKEIVKLIAESCVHTGDKRQCSQNSLKTCPVAPREDQGSIIIEFVEMGSLSIQINTHLNGKGTYIVALNLEKEDNGSLYNA